MESKKWTKDLPFSWLDLSEVFQDKPNKIVISSWTALDFFGINEDLIHETTVTVPKGYNSVKIREFANVKQRTPKKYDFQIEIFNIEGKLVNIHSPERAFVEVIKEQKGRYSDVIISLIRGFFTKFKYDVRKLIEAAEKFNILDEIINLKAFNA